MPENNQNPRGYSGSIKISALLVNPGERKVTELSIDDAGEGYVPIEAIGAILGTSSRPEGNTMCKIKGPLHLMSWVDCNQFISGPAWRSVLNPAMSMHGRTVMYAYDSDTGLSVDCPMSPAEFELTIEWENWEQCSDPFGPNKEWVDLITAAESKAWANWAGMRTWADFQPPANTQK